MRAILSPCGMACDMLRSPHVTLAEMASVPGYRFWIRWYPCAPGAKALPFDSAFISPVWESRSDKWTAPGVYMPSPEDARPKAYPAPPGQHWHGPKEWFRTGIPPEMLAPGMVTIPSTICGKAAPPIEGGGKGGGKGDKLSAFVRPARGGIRVAGEGDERVGLVRYSIGGVLAGGLAALTGALVRETEGGAVSSGTATPAAEHERYTSGGALAGGAVVVDVEYVRPTSGGALAGGAVVVDVEYVRPTSGGALAGGAVGLAGAITRQATGGVLAGGTATAETGVQTTFRTERIPYSLPALFTDMGGAEYLESLATVLQWSANHSAWRSTLNGVPGEPVTVHLAWNAQALTWGVQVTGSRGNRVASASGSPGPPMLLETGVTASFPPFDLAGSYILTVSESGVFPLYGFVQWMRDGGDLPRDGQDAADHRSLLWGAE